MGVQLGKGLNDLSKYAALLHNEPRWTPVRSSQCVEVDESTLTLNVTANEFVHESVPVAQETESTTSDEPMDFFPKVSVPSPSTCDTDDINDWWKNVQSNMKGLALGYSKIRKHLQNLRLNHS